jgi:hypothetical protein
LREERENREIWWRGSEKKHTGCEETMKTDKHLYFWNNKFGLGLKKASDFFAEGNM